MGASPATGLTVRVFLSLQALRIIRIIFALLLVTLYWLDESRFYMKLKKILQLSYAKTTLEVEKNYASKGGSAH